MKTIGKYQVIDVIGSGGMGVVYKAIDPRIERTVAIKTLPAKLDREPELRRRLLAEARAAGALSHKNIVTIYEMDEHDGTAYLAMEFLDGNELDKLIATRTPLSIEQKLQIMGEICEGLGHAHAMGLMHRDIKPGNVLITRSGQVKILDFGLAGLVSAEAAGTGAGTLAYMAPEQVRGEKLDHRSDIFSAGALFYELLSYSKPFQRDSEYATSYAICHSDPASLEQLDPEIPQTVALIVTRALAKNPAERYQDAEAMLRDLNAVREDYEQRKRALRTELDRLMASLDALARDHADLLGDGVAGIARLKEQYAELLSGPRQQATSGSGRLPLVEYRRLLALRDRAVQDYQLLDAVVEKRKRSAYLLLEIEELRNAQRPEEALKLLEYVMQEDSTYPDIAKIHQELRHETEEQLAKAEQRKQQARVRAVVVNARAALGCGRLATAREELQLAVSLNPSLAEVAELRADIERAEAERRAWELKEDRLVELLAEARRLNERADRRGTLAVVRKILELDPANWYAMALSEDLGSGMDS